MANTNKIYNINAIRPAILKAREQGNRKAITQKFCTELGISTGYWEMYNNGMKKLFEVVSDYCRLKNSPKATPAQLKDAMNKIFPLWRELLSSGEKDKNISDFRVREDDVSNLISFCQRFVNDSNNVKGEEGFVAKRAWAVEPLSAFRKMVETDMGIRVAGIEVMSDKQRDFLRAEGAILSKIKRAERSISDTKAGMDKSRAFFAKFSSQEMKQALKEQLEEAETAIKAFDTKISELRKEHAELIKAHNETDSDKAVAGKRGKRNAAKSPAEVSDKKAVPAKASEDSITIAAMVIPETAGVSAAA